MTTTTTTTMTTTITMTTTTTTTTTMTRTTTRTTTTTTITTIMTTITTTTTVSMTTTSISKMTNTSSRVHALSIPDRDLLSLLTPQSPAERRRNKTTCNSESVYTSAQVNEVQMRIWTPDMNNFQNVLGLPCTKIRL